MARNGHNGNGRKPTKRELRDATDRAVRMGDRAVGVYSTEPVVAPRATGSVEPGAPKASRKIPLIPSATFDPVRAEGNWAPLRPVPEPIPGIIPGFDPKEQMVGQAQWGGTGTPITAGFLIDLGEYNSDLYGRSAVATYEKMRRGDAQVWGTLMAVKGPLQSATWDIEPGVKTNDPGHGKAKEVAEFVKENLMGGLEFQTSSGGYHSQPWDQIMWNALLCLDFGVSVHEDVYTVDGKYLKLRSLVPLLPITYYRWHTESDGYTLLGLEQYGYRGIEFINATVPAEKICRFTLNQEGSNYWGLSLLRSAYPHYYIKSQLYRIDAIAAERNGLGVPVITLGPGASTQDRATAFNFVTKLSAHELTGLVLPEGGTFEIKGVQGQPREVYRSIEHHNRMISTTALAMFLTIGSAPHGSRATAATQHDFFLAASQHLATYIGKRFTQTTIRRLVQYNFGEDAVCPELIAKNVKNRDFEDVREALESLAKSQLLVSDRPLRDTIRDEYDLPPETDEGIVTSAGEQVENENDQTIAGQPGGGATPSGTPKQQAPMAPGNKSDQQIAKQKKGVKGKTGAKAPNQPLQGADTPFARTEENLSARSLDKRMVWHGLHVSIENKAGSVRSGTDSEGHEWSVTLTHDYGYLRNTEGVDGDHVDCFIGPDSKAKDVYVVHTMKAPLFHEYDEDKCFLDFSTEADARAAFFANYDRPEHFGSMETIPVGEFIDKVLATKKDPKLIGASDAGYHSIGDDPGIPVKNNRSGQPTQRRVQKKTVDGPPSDSAQEEHPAKASAAIDGQAPTERGKPKPVPAKDVAAKQASHGARIVHDKDMNLAEGFKPSASQERNISPVPTKLQPSDKQDTPLNPTPDPTPVVKETFSKTGSDKRLLFQDHHGEDAAEDLRQHYKGLFAEIQKHIKGTLKAKVIAAVVKQASRQIKAGVPVPQLHFVADHALESILNAPVAEMFKKASAQAKKEVKAKVRK